MIGSLRGEVLERDPAGTVLVDVGGVGYEVAVNPAALGELEPGTTVFLYVHHQIREDAQTLFGFLSKIERVTFQLLIGTHGVGPALGMAILATHPPAALADVVSSNDVAALTLVPGVGKKTAERLMVELKNRFAIPVLDSGHEAAGGATSAVGAVREALGGLGYSPEEIRDTLREIDASASAEVMLRAALSALGARRA